MLKEIHPAGSVRKPFGSFCGDFRRCLSAVELRKAAVEWGTSSAAPSAQTPRAKSGSESTK